ncbi:ribbon-helix-helix protein, CopG family [Phytoactinopolyspora halotolerans]|uniref:Ribbon-helix-helix protein, CopG family n=1 Tax=Phytoactinopolyspora halotolerans TaxID=1981512 RepID=A0A6L9SH71_9ACTN|nr:ribbon-helix-helix protein, CopG family [Phytoactinopolyspora halotolerans]NEE03671.1 ribbon-helix-helix protein, CopG family [Phytoactinopolyspora halotolerans]
MSITLDPELDREVREAARRSGKSLSAWLSEAAAQQLRAQSLREFLDDYEREHGAFTEEELARARAEMGYEGR